MRRYSKFLILLIVALVYLIPTSVVKTNAQTVLQPKQTKKSLEYKKSLIDDIYVLKLFINQQEKESKEEEEKAKREEERKVEKKDKQVETKGQSENEEPKFSNPKPVGTLRLANHNHDRETMIDHLNRFYAGTPMAGTGESTVDAGIENNVDPYALAAISRTESTCGQACANSYNPFGRKDDKCSGYKSWGSFSEALHDEARYLVRCYFTQGLNDWYSIGHKYCEDDGWAQSNIAFQKQVRDN